MSQTDAGRVVDAGVTLVEILVVLALIGTVAGAVGLGLGSVAAGTGARDEALLLAARMRRASEEALLTGQAVALVWSDRDYRFEALGSEGWGPHPVPLLSAAKPLDGAIRFLGERERGNFAVAATLIPADGAPLTLLIGAGRGDLSQAVAVTWDGATAVLSEPGP